MQTRLQRIRRKQAAFSLIEILIVIALIAILAAVAVGNLGGIFEGQQEKLTGQFVNQNVKAPMQAYRLDVGNFPTTEEGISALMKAPSGKESRWRGPYIEEIPLDPWGNEYKYRFPGTKNINGAKGYDIWSLGADGVEGTDDIGNWK